MKKQKHPTVEAFLSDVGRQNFQNETGFSVQLVQRAKDVGVFPDRWFWTVRDFCKNEGKPVPEHLFRGNPNAPVQSNAEVTQ